VGAGGELTGVVDWDGWAPGDSRADLVMLLFSARTVVGDEALARALLPWLRARLDPESLSCYLARDVVRSLGWFAWRQPAFDLEPWVARSQALLDAVAAGDPL